MSIYREFIDDIKEVLRERDRLVKIPNFIYQELLKEAGSEDDIELLLNQILVKRFDLIKEKKKAEEERQKHEEQLINYYIALDRYLFATLGRPIKIGITNRLIGKEPYTYILQDYNLSKKYSYLELNLERNGESYPISLNNIEDIRFLDLKDNLKAWIYMTYPLPTWRFYLKYDEVVVKNQIDSNRLNLS